MTMKDWEFKRMIQRLHRQVGQLKRHKKKKFSEENKRVE